MAGHPNYEYPPYEYPPKHKRLQQLEAAGLNIADFVYFPPKQLDPVVLQRFFKRYEGKHGISIRHYHEDESRFFKCPNKYEQKDWDFVLRFCQEHNQQFYTLCNEAIPVNDSLYAGSIWLLGWPEYVVEYFRGPGTPRDMEKRVLSFFQHRIGEQHTRDAPPELIDLVLCTIRFLEESRPILLEFNIYPYPVGKLHQRSILWEWRRGVLHDTAEIVEQILGENESLKAQLRLLKTVIHEAMRGEKS